MAVRFTDLAGVHEVRANIPPVLAATTDVEFVIMRAPARLTVTRVDLVAGQAIAGADTDTKHVNIIDAGLDGTGTSEKANRDFVSGTDAVQGAITNLTTTEFELDEGDLLICEVEKVGNGQALESFDILVQYEFR